MNILCDFYTRLKVLCNIYIFFITFRDQAVAFCCQGIFSIDAVVATKSEEQIPLFRNPIVQADHWRLREWTVLAKDSKFHFNGSVALKCEKNLHFEM